MIAEGLIEGEEQEAGSNYPSKPLSDADNVALFQNFLDVNQKRSERIEESVVDAYQKIEDTVVGGYQKVEDTVVGAYKMVEDHFVGKFFTREGETVEEAKARLNGHSGSCK